jgi:hypothetical protein
MIKTNVSVSIKGIVIPKFSKAQLDKDIYLYSIMFWGCIADVSNITCKILDGTSEFIAKRKNRALPEYVQLGLNQEVQIVLPAPVFGILHV